MSRRQISALLDWMYESLFLYAGTQVFLKAAIVLLTKYAPKRMTFK